MKNKVRTLGITAALAVMIPISAYAATTSGSTTDATSVKTEVQDQSFKDGGREGRGGFGVGRGSVSQEVLDLLKLDKAALNEQIKAGATLAEIAEKQGVSRDSLKSAMTAAYNKKLEEKKQEYSTNLDKVIDSDLQVSKPDGKGGGARMGQDLSKAAELLGLSEDEVKAQLKAGKSLADLATDKGVDVQKLIDAQVATITSSINEAVIAGKLTQEQADKQLAEVAERVESSVNGKGPGGGRHHGGGKARGVTGEQSSDDVASPSAS